MRLERKIKVTKQIKNLKNVLKGHLTMISRFYNTIFHNYVKTQKIEVKAKKIEKQQQRKNYQFTNWQNNR